MSVRIYHYSLRNNSEVRSSQDITTHLNYNIRCTYIANYTLGRNKDPDCCVEDLVGTLVSKSVIVLFRR